MTGQRLIVFLESLACDDVALDRHFTALSTDERLRADSFADRENRRRFIAGRGILHAILARHLNCDPSAVVIENGIDGKPRLPGNHPLKFNLSHSHERIAVALAWDLEIGIDIEKKRHGVTRDIDGIAGHVFTDEQCARLAGLAPSRREAVFYRQWTKHEAIIKALGTGFSRARAIATEQEMQDLTVRELALGRGWFGAVAAKTGRFRVSVRHGFRGMGPL